MKPSDALAQGNDQWTLPRAATRSDDPLLQCLVELTRLIDKPVSAETLTTGLPLEDSGLTPELFIRAAARAGLHARLARRPLAKIPDLTLPVVLLLRDRQACILQGKAGETAWIILPDTGGVQEIGLAELEQQYAGHLLFVRPEHRFDARTQDSAVPRPAHWFWGVAVRSWPVYAEVLLASLLINLFALAMPLFSMNVYDRVVPNHAMETLWALSFGVMLVIVFDTLIRALRGYFIDVAGKKLDVVLSANIFERVLAIRMSARPASVGAFASNLQEFEAFREFVTSATITALIDLPFVVLFVVAMFWVGGPLGWAPLLAMPLIIGASLALQAPLARLVQTSSRLAAQRQATLVESLVGLETIKVMGAEGAVQRKWEQLIGQLGKLALRSRFLSACAVNFSSFAQQAAYLAVILVGVHLIAEDKLTMGALIACSILTGRVLAPLSQVASLLTRYHQSRDALASIDRLMNLPVERPPGKDFVHRPALQGGVEFRNVSFAYPEQTAEALSEVSFTIRPGERVAIIGRVGSGKTTVEKLILGLYPPSEGAVLIDGTDQRQIDPAALRRDIGHVPQDILLFYGSVRDNIVLGAPHADDAAVLRAADIAGVTEFTSRSAQGLDLPVGERGEKLSGGQRQAIAIARAELMAPPLLLLDEPSSAMDNRSEELFKARLGAELADRTLILISHRASLLSLVNRLIVLDQGRVVADGPKEAVLAALAKGKLHAASQ
ncbi:type I secretion system permease/ATPase [Massilia litorea]|uniref:Cyclolysin secretion/processing ATP-binding protein CyaB n=1 Tax=Massilia litorea TaxID=2769491 RepID=A0A7L9U2C4_9BURK|nr:type I secretion system permease/ATPase [Massilia litorea]QOL49118.1 type I secretion system permease/ATPase [Massilia litorea]